MASFLQTPLDHVGVRRFAKCQFKRSREMSRASPCDGAQILGMNCAMQVHIDEGPNPHDLPARQSPRFGPLRTRMALDLKLQNGGGSNERCLCRLAIMLQLARRCLQKFNHIFRQIDKLLQLGWRRSLVELVGGRTHDLARFVPTTRVSSSKLEIEIA